MKLRKLAVTFILVSGVTTTVTAKAEAPSDQVDRASEKAHPESKPVSVFTPEQDLHPRFRINCTESMC